MFEDKKGYRKLVRFAWEVLDMPCEWNDCSLTSNTMQDYIQHIESEHLAHLQEGLEEEDLQCNWKNCDAFAESLSELRRHVLFHAFHTKLKCYGKNFQVRKKLPDCHLGHYSRNIIPELPEPFMCLWEDCELQSQFENPEFFYRHLEWHAETSFFFKEGKSVYQCSWPGCKRMFSDQYKLKDHVKSHSQEKAIACPTCGGMLASRTKFVDHLQRQIPITDTDPADVYVCEYCSKKLQSERLLRDHVKVHVSHYKCPCCDMTCPTPSSLHAHVSYRHCDYKPLSCQYCDYRCKKTNDLRKHLETHSLSPSYKCPKEGCEYSTRSQYCYKNHIISKHKTATAAKYACHVCSKVTTRGNYLTKHLTAKHNFCWPSGHCRFRYRLHDDGFYRLQTVRYESMELTETMLYDRGNDNQTIMDRNSAVSSVPSETVVQGTSNKQDASFPSTEIINLASNSSANDVPVVLYIANEGGGISSTPVSLQGTVNDLVYVSPSNESQPVDLQFVDKNGEQVTLPPGCAMVLKTVDGNSAEASTKGTAQ